MEIKNIFFYSIDCDLWNFILECSSVLIHFINNEAVDKPNYIWTVKEKRKVHLGFQDEYLMTNALSTRDFFHAFKFSMTKV